VKAINYSPKPKLAFKHNPHLSPLKSQLLTHKKSETVKKEVTKQDSTISLSIAAYNLYSRHSPLGDKRKVQGHKHYGHPINRTIRHINRFLSETLLKGKGDNLDQNLIIKLAAPLNLKVPKAADKLKSKTFMITVKEAMLTALFDIVN
jgi:hypothetical protein